MGCSALLLLCCALTARPPARHCPTSLPVLPPALPAIPTASLPPRPQEIDSVEYGLTDIQEYYANTGALKRAAQAARPGAKVGCSIVEAFSKDVRPRELDEVLRLEYRSKLLNPK